MKASTLNENAKIKLVPGSQASGKTFASIEYAKAYIKRTGFACLVVDVKDEKIFELNAITIKYNPDLNLSRDERANGKQQKINGKTFQNGLKYANKPFIYRLLCRQQNGDEMTPAEVVEMLITVSKSFQNGLLICEEMNSYFPKSLPDEFRSFFTNVRKSGVDVILHYQRIGDSYPQIWGNIKSIRLHKTIDSISFRSTKLKSGDFYEIIQIAEYIVNTYYDATVQAREKLLSLQNKSKSNVNALCKEFKTSLGAMFFFVDIDLTRKKIIGFYNESVFKHAVRRYLIRDNYSELTRTMKEHSMIKDIAIEYLYDKEYHKYAEIK